MGGHKTLKLNSRPIIRVIVVVPSDKQYTSWNSKGNKKP